MLDATIGAKSKDYRTSLSEYLRFLPKQKLLVQRLILQYLVVTGRATNQISSYEIHYTTVGIKLSGG